MERSYFEERAQAELSLAQAATHPAAMRAHHALADLYLERLKHSSEKDAFSKGGAAKTGTAATKEPLKDPLVYDRYQEAMGELSDAGSAASLGGPAA